MALALALALAMALDLDLDFDSVRFTLSLADPRGLWDLLFVRF